MALVLTVLLCFVVTLGMYRESKFADVDPYLKLVGSLLLTIIAYLVGNVAGVQAGRRASVQSSR